MTVELRLKKIVLAAPVQASGLGLKYTLVLWDHVNEVYLGINRFE